MHKVELPERLFLFTVDQISFMLEVSEQQIYDNYLFYEGRSVGVRPKDKMLARDISPPNAPKPDWRITDREFTRWMRLKGFRFHTRGYVT